MGRRGWKVWAWGVLAWLAGCGGGGGAPEDLASALRREPALSTFVAVVQASGLEPALLQAQGVTVFAPTDRAFEAWWAQSGTSRAELLADPARAAAFVRDHLVDRALVRTDLPTGRAITTRSGLVFKVESVTEGLVATDGQQGRARVLEGSVPVAQGYVHLVDAVLRPAQHTVLQAVQEDAATAWLAEALVVAGLATALEGPGRVTLFAPTSEAWQAHLASIGQTWPSLRNQPQRLRRMLAYHVLPGSFLRAELPVGTPMTMLEGGQVSLDRNGILTDECNCPARIVATDRFATTGVVHRIDRVMLRNP